MESLVQGTNDSSVLSKCSMVDRGYFADDYLKHFIDKRSVRRAPLINIGYYVRSLIMNHYLKHYMEILARPSQVLSLGAGFDSTFFRLASNYEELTYFEVDFSEVVKNKISCIKDNEKLFNKLQCVQDISSPFGLRSTTYLIFAQDLNNVQLLKENLTKLGMDFSLPTLIFSECAITYMEEKRSTDLICWASKNFPKGIFMTYEQINPDDGFGLVMKKHFLKIQNPLKSLDLFKTIHEQEQRYLSNGWLKCRSVSAMDLFNRLLSVDEQKKNFKLEPFDEWEEWHLKCCHYSLTIALNKSNQLPSDFIETISGKIDGPSLSWELGASVKRFGHCSVTLGKWILNIGGFGTSGAQHGRLKEILMVDQLTNESKEVKIDKPFPVLDSLYSTCTPVPNTTGCIYFGGRNSPLRPVNETPSLIFISPETEQLEVKEIATEGRSPCSRWRHSASFINNSLVIFGGRNQHLEVLGDVWVLILGKDKFRGYWKELTNGTQNLPSPRFSHSTAEANDIIYLTGGLDGNLKPCNDLWIMKLTNLNEEYSSTWNKIDVIGLKPRYGHTSHVWSNNLILIGGVNVSIVQPTVCLIELNSLVVTEYILPASSIETPIMLHNHTSVINEAERTVLVIGGGGNCFSFGTSFNSNILKIPLKQFSIPN